MIREFRPKGEWVRHHPTARRIASDLLKFPELANLRTRRLLADIRVRYGVGTTTALTALRMWRAAMVASWGEPREAA